MYADSIQEKSHRSLFYVEFIIINRSICLLVVLMETGYVLFGMLLTMLRTVNLPTNQLPIMVTDS